MVQTSHVRITPNSDMERTHDQCAMLMTSCLLILKVASGHPVNCSVHCNTCAAPCAALMQHCCLLSYFAALSQALFVVLRGVKEANHV